MGNSLNLSIQFDYESIEQQASEIRKQSSSIQAGQHLTGTVTLKNKKKIKGDIVTLLIVGKEKVHYRSPITRCRVMNERSLLQIQLQLADLRDQIIPKGRHTFEFSVKIPESLPASMIWGDSTAVGCRVEYRACASLGIRHKMEKLLVVTAAPLEETKIPYFLEPQSECWKNLGFQCSGNVTFGANVQDTQVSRGQWIRLSLACINDTKMTIRSVNIKLVESIKYHVKGKEQSDKVVLVDLKDFNLLGLVAANESPSNGLRNSHASDALLNHYRDSICQSLTSGQNDLSIKVPSTSLDTYAGSIIKVEHYIKIKFISGALCNKISSKIPIVIGNRMHEVSSPSQRAKLPGMTLESQFRPQISTNTIPEATDVTILHSGSLKDLPQVSIPQSMECHLSAESDKECSIASSTLAPNVQQRDDETSFPTSNYDRSSSGFDSTMNHEEDHGNNEVIALSELVPLAPPGA